MSRPARQVEPGGYFVGASYYTWVDQHDAVGLGTDVPISTSNDNDGFDGLLAADMPANGAQSWLDV